MNAPLCLHNIVSKVDGLFGANLTNADSQVHVEEYLERNPGGIITADDGYRSVLRLMPVLERTNTKLVVFLATGILDRTVHPYELTLSSALQKRDTFIVRGACVDREQAYKLITTELKRVSHRKRSELMLLLQNENTIRFKDYEFDIFLNWQEARHLAGHPNVEIGCHGSLHQYLPAMDAVALIDELIISRHRLSSKLGLSITKFAYPYGAQDRRVRILAQIAGYKCAYTTGCCSAGRFAKPRQMLYKQ